MSLLPPQTINHDASSEGLIASVHVDVVKIAPKKTYSMGGHDYEVWGNTYNYLIMSILRLQKRIVKIIKSVSIRTHAEPLFINLKILNCINIKQTKKTEKKYSSYSLKHSIKHILKI